MLYFFFGACSALMATSFSLIVRWEVSSPLPILGDGNSYGAVVTAHALSMIFFFLMPFLVGGFGNFFLPVWLGTPDMAFPSLNNLSFWLLLPASLFFWMALVGGAGPGWTLYPPLSSKIGVPAAELDGVIFSLHAAGLSSLLGAINFLTTFFLLRHQPLWTAPALPAQALWITVFLLLLALPVLAGAVTMLLADSTASASFFDPAGGGDPLLFQHLFWFFGHPEVYVLILPAFGIVSHVLGGGDSTSVFASLGMIQSMVAIGIVGFLVWGHHMFTVGMDVDVSAYFAAVTMVVAVPTGVKIFSWLATIWGSNHPMSRPDVLWSLFFLMTFACGGLTGLVLANAGVDLVLHDTYYVVAHFHYVLSLGAAFGAMAGIAGTSMAVWWTPFSATSGHLHATTLFMGANGVFFPMHSLGIAGAPSSVFSFWDGLLQLVQYSTMATFLIVVSMVLGVHLLSSSDYIPY